MLKIELLNKSHNREKFDCGVGVLNAFLRKTARQHIKKGISRTFVLIEESSPIDVLGFFTLTACEIHSKQLPPEYAKKYPPVVPAAKLARLEVNREKQGHGLGTSMMVNAMERVLLVSENLGITGFFADAKDEKARMFYLGFGFLPFPDSLSLFLPVSSLRKAYEKASV